MALPMAVGAQTPRVVRKLRLPAPLVALLVVSAVLGVAWAVATPPLQGPDEEAHLGYAPRERAARRAHRRPDLAARGRGDAAHLGAVRRRGFRGAASPADLHRRHDQPRRAAGRGQHRLRARRGAARPARTEPEADAG